MNKPNKKEAINLIFSAALIMLYIVCSYFYLTVAPTVGGAEPYLNTLVFAVFGLVIFYATRVGEGKPVKRFSLATLLVLDIPALYVILAQLIPSLPLHTAIANLGGTTPLDFSPLFILACVALGYGVPYTFLSGFEMTSEEAQPEVTEEETEVFEISGEFVLCEEGVDGALLVVDDYDLEFDAEKEIKLSDVTPTNDEIKAGSYVIFVATEVDVEDETEATEETEEETTEETADAE